MGFNPFITSYSNWPDRLQITSEARKKERKSKPSATLKLVGLILESEMGFNPFIIYLQPDGFDPKNSEIRKKKSKPILLTCVLFLETKMEFNRFISFVSNWHENLHKTQRNKIIEKADKQTITNKIAAKATIVGRSLDARNSKGDQILLSLYSQLRHGKFRNRLKDYGEKK